MNFFPNPLNDVPVEVALDNPPLRLSVAQISFPPILYIGQKNFPQVASFQDAVREDYPIYEEPSPSNAFHIFKSEDGWEILLSPDIFILGTTNNKYGVKDELANRLRRVSEAAKNSFNLNRVTGFGVHFINRVEDKSIIDDLDKYINPAFLSPFPDATWGSEMQLHLALPNKEMLNLRWGLVPPNQNMSSVRYSSHPGVSWILSSDIYGPGFSSFDLDEIENTTRNFSKRLYAMFRHVFNDDFIRLCGGKI